MNVVDLLHHAGASLDDPEAFETTVAQLPERLEHLMRLVAALDSGRADELRALLPTLTDADEPDLVAVANALLEPGTAPDDAANAATLLPLAGLLRTFEAARVDEEDHEPDADLVATARQRIILGAMLQLLVGAYDRVSRNPRLAGLMPRAEQLRVAGQLLALHGTVNNATLAQAFDELIVDFSAERWPDLAVHPGVLADWAHSTQPWTRLHSHGLRAAMGSDDTTRRTLLGAMLVRIRKEVDQERFLELAAPTWAAAELAESLGEAFSDLVVQLRQLQLRLQWLAEDQLPGELLESVWVHGRMPVADRLAVARELLANPPEDPDPRLVVESQLFLLAHTPDSSDVAGILEAGARGAPRPLLEGGLGKIGATPARRDFVLALHAAHTGELATALEAVGPLVREHGDAVAATSVVEEVTRRLAGGEAMFDDTLRAALDEALTALGEATLPLDLMPLVLAAVRTLLGSVPPALHPAVRRSLEKLGDSEREVAARILSLAMIDDADAAKAQLRDVGRSLRSIAPESAARDRALTTLAWILFWGDASDRDFLDGLIKPLSRFLLKDGPAPAASTAARVGDTGASLVMGLVQWFLWERAALGDDRRWIDLACRLVRVPDALEVWGVQLVRMALEREPTTVEALDLAVRAELQSLVQSGQPPEVYFASLAQDA